MPNADQQIATALPGTNGRSSTSLQVETIDPLTDTRWRSFVNASPDAGIFHHPDWLALLHGQYRYRTLAHVAVNGEAEILAGLPFALVKSRITGSRFVCVPFSDLCSPATRDGDEHAVELLLDAARTQHERDGIDVEIRDAIAGFGDPGESFYHHTVTLAPDVEAVRRSFKPSVRRRIAKSERDGVDIVRGTSREALDEFYRLHLLTRRHQGIPTQPKRFIRRFSALFERGLGFVLQARFENEPIAAAVFLTFNGVITYKYGASQRSQLHRKPNNALFMEVIRWGCANGWSALDLGRTDLGNEGLRSFKRGWGAEERVLTYSRLSRHAATEGSHGVPGVARSLIRHTPPITGRVVGEALYRHFA